MAEVAEVVRGGAADVHLHDARGEGHEGVLPPRARVVQSKRHDGCERGHRARSIKALARGRRPSLLRDTIRSIRRNLYAAPRCARRRGPIDQRKIAAFARRKPWVQIPLGPLYLQKMSTIRHGPSNREVARPSRRNEVSSRYDGGSELRLRTSLSI